MTRPPRKCKMVMPGSAMAVPLAVPQHLVELELRRVKGAEYPLVEAADLVLVHGLGRVAVQGDPLVRPRPGDALHPGTTPVPGPDHPLPVRVRGAQPAYFTCRGP